MLVRAGRFGHNGPASGQCAFYRIGRLRFTREITMRIVLAMLCLCCCTPYTRGADAPTRPNPLAPFPKREGGVGFLPSPLRGGAGGEVPPAKPNVLFIAIDDLNDWV